MFDEEFIQRTRWLIVITKRSLQLCNLPFVFSHCNLECMKIRKVKHFWWMKFNMSVWMRLKKRMMPFLNVSENLPKVCESLEKIMHIILNWWSGMDLIILFLLFKHDWRRKKNKIEGFGMVLRIWDENFSSR